MGAWIETKNEERINDADKVAPYVGAWIETTVQSERSISGVSHPTWVRGLKHSITQILLIAESRTLRGCVD